MAILRYVKAWLDEGDVDDRELVDMLVGAVERAGSLDAYLIASSLERNYHWAPDAELVDVLWDLRHESYRVWKYRVAEWVKAECIAPAHKVGDSVVVHKSRWMTPLGFGGGD